MDAIRKSSRMRLLKPIVLVLLASTAAGGNEGWSYDRHALQAELRTKSAQRAGVAGQSNETYGPYELAAPEAPEGPPQPQGNFGTSAVFPDIELVHYEEKVSQVPLTQLFSANATITLRAVNNGKVTTDPVFVSVNDSNVLMKQVDTAQKIKALQPGESSSAVTLHLTAVLPPAKSQLGQEQQVADWRKQYDNRCGVDLRVVMDWAGPKSQAPLNDHKQDYLYLGYGSSKSWQEGRPISDTVICDDKQCVSINQVNRSIYKQLACKVVGYASFVGDRISGPRGRFDAFGKARTGADPPAVDLTPTTKMQIASTSKVLTALAAIKTLNNNQVRVRKNPLDSPAYTFFPSDWTLPANSIVKQITFREFLSQTSGVQQYYASASGQDYNSLKQFFTQMISNPNAPATCPGSCTPSPKPGTCGPPAIPNPIVTNKSPCYTDTNFGIFRILLPRVAGATTSDPAQLAQQYAEIVQDKIFTPVGVQNVACKPPTQGDYALLYNYPGSKPGSDWGDLSLVCGDWGWHVSVEDYARVLVSLNAADHKILTDCQLNDMETDPSNHPVGWDTTTDGAGHRWLEKNGADARNCDAKGNNCALQTTSVGIFGGKSGCGGTSPIPGVAGVLFINSNVANQPNVAAWTVLIKAFQDATKPKP